MKIFALGGVLGPAAFFFGWLYLGLSLSTYNPVSTAISELARTGSSTATAMTVAFLIFSVGLVGLTVASWRHRRIAISLLVAVVGSTGVALAPLGSADSAHFAFAALSYVALSALPIVGRNRLGGTVSIAVGLITAGLLIFSVAGPESVHGFFQRAGLILADLWLIAYSVKILSTAAESFDRNAL